MNLHTQRVYIVAACTCMSFFACNKIPSLTSGIACTREYPVAMHFFRNMSPVNVITVNGRRYANIHTLTDQFYYDIPELNSILFVVDEKKPTGEMNGVSYHILNLKTGDDVVIKAQLAYLGSPGNTDEVSVDSSGNIVVNVTQARTNASGQFVRHIQKCVLSLSQMKVIEETSAYFDKDGHRL